MVTNKQTNDNQVILVQACSWPMWEGSLLQCDNGTWQVSLDSKRIRQIQSKIWAEKYRMWQNRERVHQATILFLLQIDWLTATAKEQQKCVLFDRTMSRYGYPTTTQPLSYLFTTFLWALRKFSKKMHHNFDPVPKLKYPVIINVAQFIVSMF